jgi:6-phosphogluconolactonase
MTNARRVLVHADKKALAGSVAARFITKVVDLLDQQPRVNIALTGGTVGIAVLEAIRESPARDSIDWSRVVVWWSDERWLPRGDAERNDTQAREALLDHVTLRAENIHCCPDPDSGISLENAATSYSAELADAADERRDTPRFDILFLGVGSDGHIASA